MAGSKSGSTCFEDDWYRGIDSPRYSAPCPTTTCMVELALGVVSVLQELINTCLPLSLEALPRMTMQTADFPLLYTLSARPDRGLRQALAAPAGSQRRCERGDVGGI